MAISAFLFLGGSKEAEASHPELSKRGWISVDRVHCPAEVQTGDYFEVEADGISAEGISLGDGRWLMARPPPSEGSCHKIPFPTFIQEVE